MKPSTLRRGMNLWPPFLFSGIHVASIAGDWRSARVELRMRPWNRNYVGTDFGGSLVAMPAPFWMILVKERLGPDHYVWDQAGEIEFLKPGRGTVHATFELEDGTVEAIRSATADGAKHLHWFQTEVTGAEGDVIARVRKQVYARRKPGR